MPKAGRPVHSHLGSWQIYRSVDHLPQAGPECCKYPWGIKQQAGYRVQQNKLSLGSVCMWGVHMHEYVFMGGVQRLTFCVVPQMSSTLFSEIGSLTQPRVCQVG